MSNALFYVFTVDKVQFYGMLISSNEVIRLVFESLFITAKDYPSEYALERTREQGWWNCNHHGTAEIRLTGPNVGKCMSLTKTKEKGR